MDAFAISLRGMETSAAQFTRAAAATVRDSPPMSTAGSAGPVSAGNLDADIVDQMTALVGYRANARAWQAASRMTKTTIDLIA